MLAKSKRLTTEEVRGVLARGRSRRAAHLSLKFLALPSPFRCAAVVSKRLAKTATQRNRLRRAVYRALHSASLPKSGHAILFVQTIPPGNLTETFTEDIKKLFHV